MTKLLRRTLLVSSTALMAITFVPTLGSMVPGPLAALIASEAQARGGDDDDDSGSDDDDSGESDDSGNDSDSDNDDSSGHDSSDDDSDDDSSDDDDSDDRSGDDDDDTAEDDSAEDDGDDNRRGRGGDRDEIRLIVNDNQLQGLLNGSMVPVDQSGKRLRFEVEEEHGQTEIKLRATKGTLTGVTVIPAP